VVTRGDQHCFQALATHGPTSAKRCRYGETRLKKQMRRVVMKSKGRQMGSTWVGSTQVIRKTQPQRVRGQYI
jgi:predicted phosphoribosyltransferase